MNEGFVKLFRQTKTHWVNERPEWFMGWSHILMSANYKTGQVNLTEVYRELSNHFNRQAWARFIAKLEADEMLCDVTTVNRGQQIGKMQSGTVKNWLKYHSDSTDSESDSKRYSQTDSKSTSEKEKQSAKRTAKRTANGQPNGQSNKKYLFKEVKEEAKLSLAGHFFQNLHPTASMSCIEELEKKSSSADWALSFWGEDRLGDLLYEATKIANGPRLGFVWADLILGTRTSNVRPKNVGHEPLDIPPPPVFSVGQKIKTPRGTIEEVIDLSRVFVITEQGDYYPKDCQAVAN